MYMIYLERKHTNKHTHITFQTYKLTPTPTPTPTQTKMQKNKKKIEYMYIILS